MTHRLMNPILLLALLLTLPPAEAQTNHAGHEDEESHEEGVVTMTPEQRQAQGIETAPVERRTLAQELIAPGEVVINAYRSTQVTPRISAQIVARHARLGDHVDTGQALVTLSSVEMADAQGALVVADREWQRVRRLGRKVVSERRYVEAQVTRQLAVAKVQAYGMTEPQIAALLRRGDASEATGAFELPSPQDGTVISDDFVVGEVVEPGRVLFEITDESVLWVEAKLSPQDATRVEIGAPARISVDGRHWLTGQVIQRHHRLDETTRTQSIRIQVDNRDDRLHAGQFVDVALRGGDGREVLAVPREAVVLMEGPPTVFKTESDELHPQPVETGATRGGWTEIRAGLSEGDQIVVRGVFLLKSLLLKSRMGEGHAH